MDRGIPTEQVLAEMRQAETPTCYLVGTPRGRLSQLEKDFSSKSWADVRDAVHVKRKRGRGSTLREAMKIGPPVVLQRGRQGDGSCVGV